MDGYRNGLSLWLFFFLQSFIQGLTTRYPEIYEEPSGDISQYQINFGTKWRGYASVATIAEDNLLMFDKVLSKPLEECLLFLCYKADKAMVEQLQHKEMMNKHKVK